MRVIFGQRWFKKEVYLLYPFFLHLSVECSEPQGSRKLQNHNMEEISRNGELTKTGKCSTAKGENDSRKKWDYQSHRLQSPHGRKPPAVRNIQSKWLHGCYCAKLLKVCDLFVTAFNSTENNTLIQCFASQIYQVNKCLKKNIFMISSSTSIGLTSCSEKYVWYWWS